MLIYQLYYILKESYTYLDRTTVTILKEGKMKKALIAIMVCFSVMAPATAVLAIQPAVAFDNAGNGFIPDSSLTPGSSYALKWTYGQLTQLSRKNVPSAYVGVDVASHTSERTLNQSGNSNLGLLNSSVQPGPDGNGPLTATLQQMYGSTASADKQINLRDVYAPKPVSVALICAGLVALPFARRFRNMLQKT